MNRATEKKYIYGAALLLLCAFLVRITDLERRPMHGDEAVNAYKLGEVLDHQVFVYDANEYHGPALYYFSWLSSRLLGKEHFSALEVRDIRLVSVFFGLALWLLWLIFRRRMGWPVTISSLFMLAFSAPILFYSRYFIHELPFVFFGYLLLFLSYCYLRQPRLTGAVLMGITLGFLVTTKETWLITLPALILSLGIVQWISVKRGQHGQKNNTGLYGVHLAGFAAAFLLVFILLFSAFFKHPAGIADALAAIPNYFSRGTGESVHSHPWYSYLSWLFYYPSYDGHVWSEGGILIFAAAGVFFILKNRDSTNETGGLILLITLYSSLLLILFSFISYKTPWNLLTFYPGIITIAAYGIVTVYRSVRTDKGRVVMGIILLIGGVHFLWQSAVLNFRYDSDPGNPYVYAHPLPDMLVAVSRLDSLAQTMPDGYDTPVQVIIKDNDYWPLPWYLRHFSRTGWWNHVPEEELPAPVIISTPSLDSLLTRFIYERPPPGEKHLYVPLFRTDPWMRPAVPVRIYVQYRLVAE